jgi:hypothetical protein
MDTSDLIAALERAVPGPKVWIPGVGPAQDHTAYLAATLDEVEALEDLPVLLEGVTPEPALPGLDYAVLRLYSATRTERAPITTHP